ncbi:unnamed protein product [Discosporangium mesarthrocarpum]
MLPSIESGSFLLIDKVSPRVFGVEKGDIVVAACPYDPLKVVVKRVTALPGELVKVRLPKTYVP